MRRGKEVKMVRYAMRDVQGTMHELREVSEYDVQGTKFCRISCTTYEEMKGETCKKVTCWGLKMRRFLLYLFQHVTLSPLPIVNTSLRFFPLRPTNTNIILPYLNIRI
jgi:hypothetical protein